MVRWIARAAVAAFTFGILMGATGPTAEAQAVGLRFPAPQGTQWQIIAGYNTATHSEPDGNDPYAIDIIRTDGTTEGTPVLSPVTGRVGYIGENCFSVRTEDVNILMCHVIADPGLERGQTVGVGQRLGYIAPPGQAGNNGYPHIHIGLEGFDGDFRGGSSREHEPLPFTGDYRMEGVSLPRASASNAHYGTRFTSTNDPSLSRVSVSAGADQVVDPGQAVALAADGDGIDFFRWEQIEGPAVAFEAFGQESIAFLAPAEPGSVLRFRVTGSGELGEDVDVVKITVRGAPVVPEESRGRILSGEAPQRGIGLIVFGGGTTEELVAAVACESNTPPSFFTADAGSLVSFIPGAQVTLVNERWLTLFEDGLPTNLALIVRCE